MVSDNLDQILLTKAKTLASATNVPEILLSTTVREVLKTVEKDGKSCILLRDCPVVGITNFTKDMIFRRVDIFHLAMKFKCLEQPFSCMVEHLVPVQQLDGEVSLDEVIRVMQSTGCEEVGIFDNERAVVRGIITCKGLIDCILHNDHGSSEHRPGYLGGEALLDEDDEEDDNFVDGNDTSRSMKGNSGRGRFSQAQLAAQVLRACERR